ncbi:putative glutathione peroxidase 5 [Lathyrus oleraceus]|uniref:Glutathione peroxidase n=1 Tax=Pisum sativum TaxID=3888 RepID=A0A9D5AFL5_PEA|nr:putative glutathione peroxidase 5 [Pisum sativum]
MGASQSVSEKSISEFTVKDAKGKDVNLSSYKGKVLLIVNVASKCGFTNSNYTQLTDLYSRYKDKGLEILAFPCNQFLNQEPGSSEDAEQFACTRFKAEYPIFGKAYSTEIFREEKQGLGLSTLSAAWGIGLVIGPALGGYLAQPAVKYPHLFPKDSFWDKFPYFLPSLSVSAFAFVVAIACIWLPETLHNHPLSNESIDDAEALETGNISNDDDKIIQKDENLFLNWPLMSSIIVYSIFSLYNVAYQEVFSLWVVSPGRFGGLNFTTDNVGDVLAISGIGLIVSQLFLYPSLERAFGPIKFARISAVLSIPLLQSYPFIAMLSGITLYLVINIASLLKNVLSMTIITGLFIMQNRAVEQHQRGAANGIAMTMMSIFKAIGPAGGGAV